MRAMLCWRHTGDLNVDAKSSRGETMRFLCKPACSWLLLLAMVSASGVAHAQGEPKRVEVTATRFSFSPAEITLKKGEPVVLVLKSTDVAHGLRFRELHVDMNVRAGGSTEVKFTPDRTGDFTGHCSVFCGAGHGTMALKLHVTE